MSSTPMVPVIAGAPEEMFSINRPINSIQSVCDRLRIPEPAQGRLLKKTTKPKKKLTPIWEGDS